MKPQWTETWRDKTAGGVVVSTVTNGRVFEVQVLGGLHDLETATAACEQRAGHLHVYLLSRELQIELVDHKARRHAQVQAQEAQTKARL